MKGTQGLLSVQYEKPVHKINSCHMNRISRYVFNDILSPAGIALFMMLGLIWLMQSLRFMDMIVNRGLSVEMFLYVSALIIPSLLLVVLPLALFAGCVITFKRLQQDNELVALFATGGTRWLVLRPALRSAVWGVAVCYVLSLFLIPASMTAFKTLQTTLREDGANLLLTEGTFNDVGRGLMVYVREHDRQNNILRQIMVHDSREAGKQVTWIADEGRLTLNAQRQPQLLLINGMRQEVTTERLTDLSFTRHTIDLLKQLTQPEERWRDAEERYLHELFATDGLTPRQSGKFYAEIHKRLLWPLAPLVLTLIAGVFLLPVYHSRQRGNRGAVMAILCAVAYLAALMGLYNVAVDNPVARWGQWALPAVVMLACLWRLRSRTAAVALSADASGVKTHG